MTRLALSILLSAMLSGCVASGPVYAPQELAAVKTTADLNEAAARAHTMTWVEASRRDAVKAREIGGARITPDDELSFALHAALAAEVDGGRMTPEMAKFKYEQHMAERRAAAAALQAEQNRRIGEAMMIAGQSMQNAASTVRPVNCTSSQVGSNVYTSCR